MVARFVRDEEVAGSNPVTPTRAEHCACRPSADCTSAPRSVFWGATPRPPMRASPAKPGVRGACWASLAEAAGFPLPGLAVPLSGRSGDASDLLSRAACASCVPRTRLIALVALRLSVWRISAKTFGMAKEIRSPSANFFHDANYFRNNLSGWVSLLHLAAHERARASLASGRAAARTVWRPP